MERIISEKSSAIKKVQSISETKNFVKQGKTYLFISYFPNTQNQSSLIITNGSNYWTDALKTIAKKFGVGYLDLQTDSKIPYLFKQSGRTDVAENIKSLRDTFFRVSATNPDHPNIQCHEYFSYIFENWLRSL